jgi:hypothetical protein
LKKVNDLTPQDAKSIFTFDQIIAGVEKLKTFQWPKFNQEESIEDFSEKINRILTANLGAFPSLVTPTPQEKVNFSIFRAREVDQIKNDQLFTEFSYPPLSFTSMGRCNFPNHPVFYASNSPLVAMLEVLREPDFMAKKLYLSSWSIIPNKDIFYFESFLRSGLTEKSLYNNFNINLEQRIGKTFKEFASQDQILGIIEYLRFVDEQFISDETYSVSASLAHRRLYAKGNFGSDMIMYPSVQSKGNDANLAINPNFVENNMRLNRVYIVSLKDHDLQNNKYSMTFHRFGEVNKNSILWNDDLTDENFKKAIAKDFGRC